MRRLPLVIVGVLFVGIVDVVRGGSSSSHTVTIRIIQPIEINIENKYEELQTVEMFSGENAKSTDQHIASVLRWKSNQNRKKVTVSVDRLSKYCQIQMKGTDCMGGFVNQYLDVYPLAQDFVTGISTQKGQCEVRTIMRAEPLSEMDYGIPQIIYTITDVF